MAAEKKLDSESSFCMDISSTDLYVYLCIYNLCLFLYLFFKYVSLYRGFYDEMHELSGL